MKRIVKYGLIIVALAAAGSCEEFVGPTVDCDECSYSKPDSADLIIYVTISGEHPEVPYVLYRGDVEEAEVDWVDTIRESPHYLRSAIGQEYSIAAKYLDDGKTIMAIDGDAMKVRDATSTCTFECWIVTGGILHAELKSD